MRRYSIPDGKAAAKILPKSRKDRRALWSIGGFLGLMVVFIVAVLFVQHRRQREIEDTWQSATATIEDVRPVVVSQVNNQFGGAMLYQAEVLAHYTANGFEQRRWIRIERRPGPSPDENQIARWKGKQFVVRWKASQPDQVVPELN
jgi:ABC-type microcin C transport system permease subunit YejE